MGIFDFFFKNKTTNSDFQKAQEQSSMQISVQSSSGCVFASKNGNSLTFQGVPNDRIADFQNILEKVIDSNQDCRILATFLLRYNIKVKEIENYFSKYRIKYENNLSELKQSDQLRKPLHELKYEAAKYLGLKNFENGCVILTLITGWEKEKLILLLEGCQLENNNSEKIINLFGGESLFHDNFDFYLNNTFGSAFYLASDHYCFKYFNSFTTSGLVKRGKDISHGILLPLLKLKDLNAISSKKDMKFRTIKDAREFLSSIPEQELKQLVTTINNLDNYFHVQNLSSDIDMNLVTRAWDYHKHIAEFVFRIIS